MITILAFGDLEEVAHELLERRDLEVMWAMTVEEAVAVSRTSNVDLVLTSDPYAFTYLTHHAQLPRKPPCLVVLGSDAEGKSASYLAAGATLVVPKDAQKILEALSHLTGVAFRIHRRIPLETVLDVEIAGRRAYLSSIDLSISGVGIAGVPDVAPGTPAKIGFEMFDPPLVVDATVVRTFKRRGVLCAGLCFTEMSFEARRRLREFIAQMIETTDISSGALDAYAGTDTRDLMSLLARETDAGLTTYVSMLVEVVKGVRARAPSWIVDLARELTETELRSIELGAPAWARAAIGTRVVLRAQLIGETTRFDPGAVLDLCRVMAFETMSSRDREASDATIIRAELLRDVYRIQRARSASHAPVLTKSEPLHSAL